MPAVNANDLFINIYCPMVGRIIKYSHVVFRLRGPGPSHSTMGFNRRYPVRPKLGFPYRFNSFEVDTFYKHTCIYGKIAKYAIKYSKTLVTSVNMFTGKQDER